METKFKLRILKKNLLAFRTVRSFSMNRLNRRNNRLRLDFLALNESLPIIHTKSRDRKFRHQSAKRGRIAISTDEEPWVGCSNRDPYTKGYSCALWQLFHVISLEYAHRWRWRELKQVRHMTAS